MHEVGRAEKLGTAASKHFASLSSEETMGIRVTAAERIAASELSPGKWQAACSWPHTNLRQGWQLT